ncbi:MAG: hypothetical protein JNK37_20940 [Verrucomicrobiales bacterium]|nr:hypothetical protein [Verrucomicrobiales bacterium]
MNNVGSGKLISSIGLRAHRSLLPDRYVPLSELRNLSPAENLTAFGFDGAWICDDVSALAVKAAGAVIAEAGLRADDIDALFWAGSLPDGHGRASTHPEADPLLSQFCYRGSWAQEELGLERAFVCGIAQQGCAGMFAALRQARALLLAEPALNHILCVGADAFPPGAGREVLYNVISDAASAVVVSRENARYRWLGQHQVSKGWYWDVPNRQSEIVAAYFPTAAATIRQTLSQSGCRPRDVDLVIPTGVNALSWPILMRLCSIAEDRLFAPTVRFGHTISADSFLYLEQAFAAGILRPGMRVLLFAYGFGSSWSAMLLETTDLVLS